MFEVKMEGPSLVIASEELARFVGKKIDRIDAQNPEWKKMNGQKLVAVRSWGKHFILIFNKSVLRIHFLMFGSYRINKPRENRVPKLQLSIGNDDIYFYSCAIREITQDDLEAYDESADLMNKKWSPVKALKKVNGKENAEVADVLMDQEIFAGLGNIMKNETLFRLRMHPQTKIKELSLPRRKALVKVARAYAMDFYRWKKTNVLKRNWQIMRKKTCPLCGRAVKKKSTGKLQRLSHFCSHCQKKA
jgi:endonuclease-8